jgi:adenosylcobyric acid synthase
MKKRKHIAVLGTGSDVGKSIITAAICRSFADRGYKVAPFKAQNMSNNSGVTPEGLEMGRAQIVQAEAARVVPHVSMNPILLKPSGEKGAQVILNGVVFKNLSAMDYHKAKPFFFKQACQAFKKLESEYDLIVLEGAGSCAEVNLMPTDIVNFQMARFADADVVLVADIHRGGVFAQIVGTLECLPDEYRNMITGIVINRFRGDMDLFKTGIDWIEQKTHKKILGVLPWFSDFKIEDEDSVVLENRITTGEIHFEHPAVAIIRFPHISNFTDFQPLAAIKNVNIFYINSPRDLSSFKSVILPGSKNTRKDLSWLMETGLADSIRNYAETGGNILGICGGYQMLGKSVEDPEGIEGEPGQTPGLDLLPVQTVLKAPKTTTVTQFKYNGIPSCGYEIHMGTTKRFNAAPFLEITSRNNIACEETDGIISEDKTISGTYIHGLFDHPLILRQWLSDIGIKTPEPFPESADNLKDRNYQKLKTLFETHISLS